jgi:fumarylpyruvate hydrolase
MPATVFPASPPATLTVLGRAERFPVHRIYCVGQNYAEHSREMGSDPERVPPFFFAKPADAVFEPTLSGALPYPCATENLHHEVEWVIALGAPLHRATPEQALAAAWGQAVGLDLTRRDLQAAAKANGKPWDTAKGFDRSAVMGPIQPIQGTLPMRGRIALSVNGQARQQGDLSDLIWPVAELLARLSEFYELQAGDLVFTGTPAGVGPLLPGDRVEANIDGLPPLTLEMAPRV